MKKGVWAFLLAILIASPILIFRSNGEGLLNDLDTKVILETCAEQNQPLYWFTHDWPLENHFYRPISTLVFEFDRLAHPTDGAAFALTNALLAFGCALGIYLLASQLHSRMAGYLACAITTIWTLDFGAPFARLFWWVAPIPLLFLLSPGRDKRKSVLCSLLWVTIAIEMHGMADLRGRMLNWVPGRTASTMTLFLLLGLVVAAWVLMQGAKKSAPPSSLDLPATKSSVQSTSRPGIQIGAAAIGAFFLSLLALGSYEQAVVLLPITGLLFVVFRSYFSPFRIHLAGAAVIAVVAYFAVRMAIVPLAPSGYQQQQFREGGGVWLSVFQYAMPGVAGEWLRVPSLIDSLDLWLTPIPYTSLISIAASLLAIRLIAPQNRLIFFGWIGSFIAFLPLAWFKHFDHYHYLSMLIRSCLVTGLLFAAVQETINAVRRPTVQAPPRPDPAPGSLAHP